MKMENFDRNERDITSWMGEKVGAAGAVTAAFSPSAATNSFAHRDMVSLSDEVPEFIPAGEPSSLPPCAPNSSTIPTPALEAVEEGGARTTEILTPSIYDSPTSLRPGAVAVPGPGDPDGSGDDPVEMGTRSSSAPILTAELVDDEELQRQMLEDARERVMNEAIRAVAVTPRGSIAPDRKRWFVVLFASVALVSVVGAIIGTQIVEGGPQVEQSEDVGQTGPPQPHAGGSYLYSEYIPTKAPSQTASAGPTRELVMHLLLLSVFLVLVIRGAAFLLRLRDRDAV